MWLVCPSGGKYRSTWSPHNVEPIWSAIWWAHRRNGRVWRRILSNRLPLAHRRVLRIADRLQSRRWGRSSQPSTCNDWGRWPLVALRGSTNWTWSPCTSRTETYISLSELTDGRSTREAMKRIDESSSCLTSQPIATGSDKAARSPVRLVVAPYRASSSLRVRTLARSHLNALESFVFGRVGTFDHWLVLVHTQLSSNWRSSPLSTLLSPHPPT